MKGRTPLAARSPAPEAANETKKSRCLPSIYMYKYIHISRCLPCILVVCIGIIGECYWYYTLALHLSVH